MITTSSANAKLVVVHRGSEVQSHEQLVLVYPQLRLECHTCNGFMIPTRRSGSQGRGLLDPILPNLGVMPKWQLGLGPIYPSHLYRVPIWAQLLRLIRIVEVEVMPNRVYHGQSWPRHDTWISKLGWPIWVDFLPFRFLHNIVNILSSFISIGARPKLGVSIDMSKYTPYDRS
jgi:hypothetical protein